MSLVVGVDFDNALVDYGALFHRLYTEHLGPAPELARDKTAVRDALRRRDGGEALWRQLQALAYGPRIGQARLYDGARDFLADCRRAGARVCVISHKTRHPGGADHGPDLRRAALDFLGANGLLAPLGPLEPHNIFFRSTRAAKAAQVALAGCTHFVDDLAEVFAEPLFPADAVKLLFCPGPCPPEPAPGVALVRSWAEARQRVLLPRGDA